MSVTPPCTQSAYTEGTDHAPSPENLAELLGRGSLRKLYAVQTPAWREHLAHVCRRFPSKSPDQKIVTAWNLILSVKRFLFFPEEKLSQKQMARELRQRAFLEGSESMSPMPIQANGSPTSALKRAEELVRVGSFSRAAKILEAPLDPPANPYAASYYARRLHPTGGPYTSGLYRYDQDVHGALPSPADVARKVRGLALLCAPGPSGWTKELLAPALMEDDPRECVRWIVHGIITNTLPNSMMEIITGGHP